MSHTTVPVEHALSLSAPVFANGEIHFSAFGPGWGFCSYTLPAHLVVAQLGAADSSQHQLNLAYQLNRQRIIAAVAEGGVQDPHARVILLKV